MGRENRDLTQDYQRNRIPHEEGTAAEHSQRIGRYRIEKVLGKGSFGLVYLSHTEQLNRQSRSRYQFLAPAMQQYAPAYPIARFHKGLGDFEQANIWMNKAIADREDILVYLNVFANKVTRANPYYPEWLKEIGLVQ